MLTKTKIALAAALIVGSASVALADGEFDGNLGNRYPAYSGATATQGTFQQAPVALHRNGQLRTAPVRLQNQGTFNAPTQGAGRLPHAFIDQQQREYPQSPPGGGY